MKKNNKSADCLYKFYFIHSALEYICSFRAVRNADFGLRSVWSTSCPAFATSKISHSTLCSKIKFIFHFINSYYNFMNNLLCYTAACCFLCLDPQLALLNSACFALLCFSLLCFSLLCFASFFLSKRKLLEQAGIKTQIQFPYLFTLSLKFQWIFISCHPRDIYQPLYLKHFSTPRKSPQ